MSLSFIALFLGLSGQASQAILTSTVSATHSIGSATCFRQATVQSGTATSSGVGVTTVTLGTAVTAGSSFLLFSMASNSSQPVGSRLSGRLASSTSVEFNRVTDESSTININWSVVAYTCGVTVQRGTTPINSASTNVAITAVPSLAQTFVTWSGTPEANDGTWGPGDQYVVKPTSTTNLSIVRGSSGDAHEVSWQVVSFSDSTMINVQRGTTSLAQGVTSTTVAVTSLDTSKTFVLVDVLRAGSGDDIGSGMLRAQLTNATTITLDRSASNYEMTEISWQAIELKDGSTVQSGTVALGNGVATATTGITAIDPARSTVFASTQVGAGQSGGRSSYVDDDIVGAATVRLSFNSATQISLTRNNSSFATDIGWFVVQWGKP